MRHMLDDPADMTSSQRRHEIAAILARGVLRLRGCAKTSPASGEFRMAEEAPESGRDWLEEAATSGPHGPAG